MGTMVSRYHLYRAIYPRMGHTNYLHTTSSIQTVTPSTNELSDYPLPWPHSSRPYSSSESFLNRLAGLHLLKRVVRNLTGIEFVPGEFLEGAKDAIHHITKLLSLPDQHEKLKGLLHPDLYKPMISSLTSLPESSQIYVDIESIRHLKLIGVNSVVGSANPDDEHIISWLGQKIITSQSKLENLMETNGRFTIEAAREIGKEATLAKMEFLILVSFNTKEKFVVIDKNNETLQGSNQLVDGYHLWKFGSEIYWDSEYPLQWTIYDINQYLFQRQS